MLIVLTICGRLSIPFELNVSYVQYAVADAELAQTFSNEQQILWNGCFGTDTSADHAVYCCATADEFVINKRADSVNTAIMFLTMFFLTIK